MADKSIWHMGYFINCRRLDIWRLTRIWIIPAASHYIINYQKKAGNRFFRMEAYYKIYNGLINTYPAHW